MILATVISGFLGSGKTTLINRLLRQPHGKRIAVIVNELGEIGIDGALIQGAQSFVELDNGCLCCAVNQDLEKTLNELRLRGGIDHVVIETTGVADPLSVFWTLSRPSLAEAYRPNLIVCLVDVRNVEQQLDHPIARLQIEQAHLLILSKSDLVKVHDLENVRALLRTLNPHAVMVMPEDPAVSLLLLDAWPEEGRAVARPYHPDITHHGFSSISISTAGKTFSRNALETFLEDLPSDVVRVKGIVSLEGESKRIAVHKVGDDISWDPVEGEKGVEALVLIGQGLDHLYPQGVVI